MFTKLVNKRAEKSHQKKITKRTTAQNGFKKTKSSFHISSNDSTENIWYLRDGSICDGSRSVSSGYKSFFFMERIKRLEEQLATKNEVKLSYLIILYVIDVNSAHCFLFVL